MTWTGAMLWAAAAGALLALGLWLFVEWDSINPAGAAKRKAALTGPREGSPFTGSRVPSEMREAVEPILEAWRTADPAKLPPRMNRTMREMSRRTLSALSSRGLGREFRLSGAEALLTGKKADFEKWNDGGREWRQGTIRADMLERYVRLSDGSAAAETFYRDARFVFRQSRRIRAPELAEEGKKKRRLGIKGEPKKEFYADARLFTCPSCGAELTLDSAEITCPWCGGEIRSDFYDWQTESFRFEENRKRDTAVLFLPLGLLTALFGVFAVKFADGELVLTLAGLAASAVFAAVLTAVFAVILPEWAEKKREGQIVRYSERLFQNCVVRELWKEEASPDVIDFVTAPLRLKKVTADGDTVRAEIAVPVTKKTAAADGKIVSDSRVVRGTWVRARYPARLKSSGETARERFCPSCGANRDPDGDGCCAWCGAPLERDTTLWEPYRGEKG